MSAAQSNPVAGPGNPGATAGASPVARHPASEARLDEIVVHPAGAPPARASKLFMRRFLMITGTLVVVAGATAAYMMGGRYVGTDDAYVKAAQLTVTTDVSGLVKSVNVHEGQHVQAGDVLFSLDAEPFEIALQNAKAAELQAELAVGSLKANYQAALQQVRAQQAQVDVAKTTLARYAALAAQGAIPRIQLDQQQATYLSAVGTLNSLRQAAAAALAKLGGNPNMSVNDYPDVLKARAQVSEAQRQLDHTVVKAPFAGTVTAVGGLQPGTLIISAMAAFSTTSAVGLVSDKQPWIEANMKETDLTRVHPGQLVDIRIDAYPDCHWRGEVASVAAASGSAFSPLPAQNTSGNWVKVVQRIPVKVKILGSTCQNVRLSAGMSTVIEIDTGHRRWHRYWNA